MAGKCFNKVLNHKKLIKSNPNLPPEVTCYSCIIAVLDDYVMYIITVIYGIQVILQLTVSSCVLFYILNFVKTCQGMSTATIKLQKMMILSLFIQVTLFIYFHCFVF